MEDEITVEIEATGFWNGDAAIYEVNKIIKRDGLKSTMKSDSGFGQEEVIITFYDKVEAKAIIGEVIHMAYTKLKVWEVFVYDWANEKDCDVNDYETNYLVIIDAGADYGDAPFEKGDYIGDGVYY